MAQILETIEQPVLRKLIFMHCPVLTVPTAINQLHSLRGFEIFNSTLIGWSEEARITLASHPGMNDIFFGKTNVSEIPSALLHNDLPAVLHGVGFFNSSLQRVPGNLSELWNTSGITHLSFESTKVKWIPASLKRLRLKRAWFTNSYIEELPDDLFVNSRVESLRLSENPLKRLPNSTVDTTKLGELLVERTNVTSLPSWVANWLDQSQGKTFASFFGSPVCDPASQTDEIDRWGICSTNQHSWFRFVPYEIIQLKYPV